MLCFQLYSCCFLFWLCVFLLALWSSHQSPWPQIIELEASRHQNLVNWINAKGTTKNRKTKTKTTERERKREKKKICVCNLDDLELIVKCREFIFHHFVTWSLQFSSISKFSVIITLIHARCSRVHIVRNFWSARYSKSSNLPN